MKIYKNIEQNINTRNAVVTVGTFDGVHIGHQVIISRLNEIAKEIGGESVVITFTPHPQIVLRPDENIFILNTEEEKIKLLNFYKIDHLIIMPFTPEFAAVSYIDFIKDVIIEKLHAKKLVIGHDHHFGKNREGMLLHLLEYGKKFNFEVEEIKVQKINEIAVSSTKIRKALTDGDIKTANNLLGYNYSIKAKVVHGNGIGQNIGFPTANMEIENEHKLLPPFGVYAVEVEFENKIYRGMLSTGVRPTINGTKRVTEVNIFNFDKNIYSKYLNVSFVERLRDEIKFKGLDELKKQLTEDKKNVLKIL
ncbi:MAG: bifunctional riboflavin kinase/FAD synthetase [Bacteroidetes bacterium]|nr:bifunctional riboflavin kinase/FAD synthetase [Bacteroidota bacterium]